METKFKIYYDDQPNEVADKIASAVAKFGISIKDTDGGDGFIEYIVTKNETTQNTIKNNLQSGS